jgi:hypothetical protein
MRHKLLSLSNGFTTYRPKTSAGEKLLIEWTNLQQRNGYKYLIIVISFVISFIIALLCYYLSYIKVGFFVMITIYSNLLWFYLDNCKQYYLEKQLFEQVEQEVLYNNIDATVTGEGPLSYKLELEFNIEQVEQEVDFSEIGDANNNDFSDIFLSKETNCKDTSKDILLDFSEIGDANNNDFLLLYFDATTSKSTIYDKKSL